MVRRVGPGLGEAGWPGVPDGGVRLAIAYCINRHLCWLAMADFDGEAGLRALADPRRRQMLALVWERERSSSDLARCCQLSRPAASQHLKVLREADLVSVRTEGNRRWYRVGADRLPEHRGGFAR